MTTANAKPKIVVPKIVVRKFGQKGFGFDCFMPRLPWQIKDGELLYNEKPLCGTGYWRSVIGCIAGARAIHDAECLVDVHKNARRQLINEMSVDQF